MGHPHTTGYFPAALRHPCPNLLENVRVILGDVEVELRLALGEVKLRELLHQPQDTAEGARCLAPGLAGGPQPGYVYVGVSHGDDVHCHRWPCRRQALIEGLLRYCDAIVEAVPESLTEVQLAKRLIKGVQQARPGGIVLVQFFDHAQCHAGCGCKIAGGLVNLHDFRSAHQDWYVPRTHPTV